MGDLNSFGNLKNPVLFVEQTVTKFGEYWQYVRTNFLWKSPGFMILLATTRPYKSLCLSIKHLLPKMC